MTELKGPERRAAAFRRMREAQGTEMAEDYVELISEMITAYGEARLTELSNHIGVTKPAVSRVIKRLQRDGLVERRPYRSIFLTEQGQAVAEMSRRRHRIVEEFLRALGIDELTAEADAQGMDHHVSDETLAALECLTDQLSKGQGE